jgi:hypothetical protein
VILNHCPIFIFKIKGSKDDYLLYLIGIKKLKNGGNISLLGAFVV